MEYHVDGNGLLRGVTVDVHDGWLRAGPDITRPTRDAWRMTIAREEIFGPCALVMPFDSEEEVIKRANATEYGLAASIYTTNVTRAHRVAMRMQVGLVWVNSWFLRDLRTPFGGAKQSGIGREGGVHSLEFYTELKNICIKL